MPGLGDDPFGAGPTQAEARSVGRAGFTFYGSGFGHGLGMSQWGAYGLAQQGWSYRRILTNFYRGTQVRPDPRPVRTLRVGLTDGRSLIHLGARAGSVRLWVGSPRGNAVGTIPGGKTWSVKATPTGYAVRDSNGNLVGDRRWGGGAVDLFATYADQGSRVFVPEADAVSGVGYAYGRSHLEFNLYRTGGAWRQRIILPIALEQYLYGIGEMPSSWPQHALQAQAVASRTFATHTARTNGRRPGCNCDITDGANDQVYVGHSKEVGAAGRRWVRAVDSTRRRIVTFRGKAILAVFAASDGGHSDSVEDVWHGGNPAFSIPYLRAECDPGEDTAANPWTDWERSLSAAELTSRLSPYTGGIGTVRDFSRIERGAGGRIITATVRGGSRSVRITGAELRAAISAWDGRIWIDRNKNITGAIRDRYDALMCKPGLPTSPVTSTARRRVPEVPARGHLPQQRGGPDRLAAGRDLQGIPRGRRQRWPARPAVVAFAGRAGWRRRSPRHQDALQTRPDLRAARQRGPRLVGRGPEGVPASRRRDRLPGVPHLSGAGWRRRFDGDVPARLHQLRGRRVFGVLSRA